MLGGSTTSYLQVHTPNVGLNVVLSMGFQRVVTLQEDGKSSDDALERTHQVLQELYIGWGSDSREWADLCRILEYFGFPTGRDDLKGLAAHACQDKKKMVELLCAAQSICLQRLTSGFQGALRGITKDVAKYRERAEKTRSLDFSDSQVKMAIAARLELEKEKQDLASKMKLLEAKVAELEQHNQQLEQLAENRLDVIEEMKASAQQRLASAQRDEKLLSELEYLRNRLSQVETIAFNQAVEINRLGGKVEYEEKKIIMNTSTPASAPKTIQIQPRTSPKKHSVGVETEPLKKIKSRGGIPSFDPASESSESSSNEKRHSMPLENALKYYHIGEETFNKGVEADQSMRNEHVAVNASHLKPLDDSGSEDAKSKAKRRSALYEERPLSEKQGKRHWWNFRRKKN